MNAPAPTSLSRRPIRDLPDELISQIAAGEVVERPASAVRELVDNALDAGATAITVRLSAGGVRLISVEDDGAGIPQDELPVALRRHATSKIASLDDLESVATMGFRGEALAAIASVSEMSLLSRTAQQPSAFLLHAPTGELRPAARGQGTTVEVKELFFSTPARRKFLKTDATELAHCIEAVRRHALARPDVGFAIWHEGKLVEQWRATLAPDAPADESALREALDRRLADVLGDDFLRDSVAVHQRTGHVTVTGRAGLPDTARSRADQQFCYVNGRFVRDKVLTHAARSAYEDVLHGQRQPVYALYVRIDPQRVDVNVHPTKIEVRFRDSREVHQAVRHAVENALAAPAHGRWPLPPNPPAARQSRQCRNTHQIGRKRPPGKRKQPSNSTTPPATRYPTCRRCGPPPRRRRLLPRTWRPHRPARRSARLPQRGRSAFRSLPCRTRRLPGRWAAPWRRSMACTSWPRARKASSWWTCTRPMNASSTSASSPRWTAARASPASRC